MIGETKGFTVLALCFIFAATALGDVFSRDDVILYDFEKDFDVSEVETEYTAVNVVSTDSGRALGIEVLSSEEQPTVTLNLPEEYRNLSAKRYVEMDIKNLSDEKTVLTFWALSGAGWGGMNSAAETKSGRELLEPKSTTTLKIDLYGRYPGPDTLAGAIDPAKVRQLKIAFHIRQGGFKFEVDNVRVTGERPTECLDSRARFAVPEVTAGEPAPGKRVRQQLALYEDTDVAHILYLPKNWQRGKLYPIIVEYTGNIFYHKYCHSTGLTEQGNMAYGLCRGEDFICINMPFISEDARHEQVNGWGSEEKTIDYCLDVIRYVCENYGGDPGAVIITGFSRGLIACNYIALSNDKIADVWLGFLGNPESKWKGGDGWNNSGIGWDDRAKRVKGRSCFLRNPDLGPAHVDMQYLEDSEATIATRRWLKEVVEKRPGTSSISGKVTDKDGKGIEGVRIQSGYTHFTFTDEKGDFILKSLIDGERIVAASKDGFAFEPVSRHITVDGNNIANVDFNATAGDVVVQRIDFSSLPNRGVKTIEKYSGAPDKDGILGSFELVIPAFSRGCFFSDRKTFNSWHGGGNQIAPQIFKDTYGYLNSDKYAYRAAFIIFELEDGSYLAVTPFSGSQTMSWAQAVGDKKLMLYFGTLGTKAVSCDVPLFAWARSDDVYVACREAWEEVIGCKLTASRTDFRYTKYYPEPFKYLGWCSWEEYKKDITSDLLVDVVKRIENSGLPIRYILVDDGHQQGVSDDTRLKSFKPDPKKFPNGWKPFLDMRKDNKIKWMGVWHSFGGLQNGVHPDNDFGGLNEHLMKVTRPDGYETLVPKDNPESSQAFYDALIGSVKNYGFDFAKIDYQMRDLEWYIGTDNAVEATVCNLAAMENAAKSNLKGLINCMAHNNVCIFNTKYSAITRCSKDYKVGNAPKSKDHLWQSFNNTIWQCQTVWGDHDMFHSCDPYSGRMMAVSKAMSAAPVYMSDNPNDFVAGYIIPLSYENGELLRPSAPGGPLPESIFIQPMEEKLPYRVIAPFESGSAAIVVYNLYSGEGFDYWAKENEKADVVTTVNGFVSPSDYTYASGMIQPYKGKWEIPAEGLVCYDWYAQSGFKLDKKYEFELKGFADKFFIVSPVENGWAVIGRSDKYMSPAAVEVISNSKSELEVRMFEIGPLTVYSEKGRPGIDGAEPVDIGNGLYRFDLPISREVKVLTVKR